ncbi:substrate-binding periplasmic protein [Vibrio tapetis]|uniref:substrate-binding periplasmic protein n=1 Tax=Vibrio tapetis TaxID=52443 RepID=UPI0025B3D2A6|nr:transporter substrate-binding domain-containing protein [Vibrio tapetis]
MYRSIQRNQVGLRALLYIKLRAAAVLFLLFPLAGYSQEPGKLTCYSTVFSPFVIEDNGEIKGIDVDVIKEVGRRLHLDISFALKPWKRLEQDVKDGTVSCVAAYFRTEERREYMDFTNVPLHITSYTLFTNKAEVKAFKTFKDLKGWAIGVNRGFKTTPEFESAMSHGLITKHDVKSDEQSVKMVSSNRLDAMLTNYHVGLYNIKKLGASDVRPLLPSIRSTPAYLVFSKKQNLAHLVPKFDEVLFSVIQDGTYQRIVDQYLQTE